MITVDEPWRKATAVGGGPDWSEIHVQCSVGDCQWEEMWEDITDLGTIVETVTEHMREDH